MQIVFFEDNLHEMEKRISGKNNKNIILSSAEFAQCGISVKLQYFRLFNIKYSVFNLSIETDRLEQTRETKMRCCGMCHLIRVYTVTHSIL